MSKAKKKHVIETHGQVDTLTTQPTMLEQVWGYNDLSRYGTKDPQVYGAELDGMTRSDLENHARQKGEVIVESTARLKEKLLTRFRSYVALLDKPLPQKIDHSATKASVLEKARADALKTLSEGR